MATQGTEWTNITTGCQVSATKYSIFTQTIHSRAVFKLNCGKAIDISLQANES
jgi:hypothetical protein